MTKELLYREMDYIGKGDRYTEESKKLEKTNIYPQKYSQIIDNAKKYCNRKKQSFQ